MASTFTTDRTASTAQARAGINFTSVIGTYELTAALVINDVVQMVKIPSGAVICEVILGVDDLDDGTALVLDVGDGDSAERFIKDSTAGQAGGFVRLDQMAGLGYQYTAADTIDVKVSTAPGTGATSGTITLAVMYTMQDDV